MISLTQKDLLELKYWLTANMQAERAIISRYLELLRVPTEQPGATILEIGTGPHWGLLPFIQADRKFGIDPLYPAYYAAGILDDRNGIFQIDEPFEKWDTNETFDTIVTTNALDHGEMGFYLMPKLARLLKPGGRLFLHVQLRPETELNLIHDHALTVEQLDRHLGYTDLIQERRQILSRDLDGTFPALVGVWRKPQ